MKMRRALGVICSAAVILAGCNAAPLNEQQGTSKQAISAEQITADESRILTWEEADAIEAVNGVLTIPDGIAVIEEKAFNKRDDFKSVVFPESVAEIGRRAFQYCSIESLTVPGTVSVIGEDAFQDCTELTEVTISAGVCEIKEGAFQYCGKLETVVIESGITELKSNTFNNCHALKSITLPETLTAIESSAFDDCRNLDNLYIPDSVTSMGDSIFGERPYLDVHYKGKAYNSKNDYNDLYTTVNGIATEKNTAQAEAMEFEVIDGTVIIPDGTVEIKAYAFSQRSDITGVSIPDSVARIGEYAFEKCSNLKEIVIPESVFDISEGAFTKCTALERAVLPNSIVLIPDFLFDDCTALKSVIMPENTIRIGADAFNGCENLTEINIPESVIEVGGGAFGGCTGFTNDINLKNVIHLGQSAFACSGIKSIVFPDNVTEIPDFSVISCENLTEIIVPEGVTRIGEMAFSGCDNVTSISIPESIEIIDFDAFPTSEKLTVSYKNKTYAYNDAVLFYSTFREAAFMTSPLTTDELCGMLYYNGKQLQLPLTAEELAALNDNWRIDDDGSYAAFIYEVDENGDMTGNGIIFGTHDLGGINSREDVNKKFIMSGIDLGGFSINGNIEIGDSYIDFKNFFGEPEEAYPYDDSVNLNGIDYYWFRDEKRNIRLSVEYLEGNISNIGILIEARITD